MTQYNGHNLTHNLVLDLIDKKTLFQSSKKSENLTDITRQFHPPHPPPPPNPYALATALTAQDYVSSNVYKRSPPNVFPLYMS